MRTLQLILLLTFIMLAASLHTYAQDKTGTTKDKNLSQYNYSWKWGENVTLEEIQTFTCICDLLEMGDQPCKEVVYELIYIPKEQDAVIFTSHYNKDSKIAAIIRKSNIGDAIFFNNIRIQIDNKQIKLPDKAFRIQ